MTRNMMKEIIFEKQANERELEEPETDEIYRMDTQ